MAVPGSPFSPSILKPVAAIATLFSSREERIQRQKERRERRKEMLRNGGKAAKVDSDAKGDVHVEDKDSEDEAPTSLTFSGTCLF